MLRLPGTRRVTLVFLPGFMASAQSYRAVLEPTSRSGATVVVPQLYRRGVGALAGRFTVVDEAEAAAEVVRAELAARPADRLVIGGHSRGGQAAWRAAALLGADLPDGLVLIDPVDGEGRDTTTPSASVTVPAPTCPTLIIGAGIGGRCAPDPVNHRVFAAAAPDARHELIADMGHADLLCGRSRDLGRRLCPGGVDPDRARDACASFINDFVSGILSA